jgi:hypothetical protein
LPEAMAQQRALQLRMQQHHQQQIMIQVPQLLHCQAWSLCIERTLPICVKTCRCSSIDSAETLLGCACVLCGIVNYYWTHFSSARPDLALWCQQRQLHEQALMRQRQAQMQPQIVIYRGPSGTSQPATAPPATQQSNATQWH